MARIKYCPNCHFFNAPAAMQCSQCGRDIGNVKAITEENARKKEEQELLKKSEVENKASAGTGNDAVGESDVDKDSTGESGNISNDLEQYIECEECHYHNSPTLRTCVKCGESLAGIPITKKELSAKAEAKEAEVDSTSEKNNENEDKKPGGTLVNTDLHKRLGSLDGDLVLELNSLEITLGRQATGSEYFVNKPFVGRNHAKVTVIGSDVYIQDLNSTNGTYIDGLKLEAGNAIKLCTENIIGLGGNATSQTDAAFLRLM